MLCNFVVGRETRMDAMTEDLKARRLVSRHSKTSGPFRGIR